MIHRWRYRDTAVIVCFVALVVATVTVAVGPWLWVALGATAVMGIAGALGLRFLDRGRRP